MAVLSRPSLRSSAHNDAGPASHVIGATNQSTKPRPAKRTRLPSPNHDSDASSKKLKTVVSTFNRRNSTSNRDALKTLPFRSRQQASTNGVTPDLKTRKLDPVLVQPKSTIFTSSQDSDESLHYGINQNIPPPPVDKRSLRSHVGGSRSRSELEPYFSNYEDLISIEPKDIEFLSPDTILHIYDESSTPGTFQPDVPGKGNAKGKATSRAFISNASQEAASMTWPDEQLNTLTNASRIDFSTAEKGTKKYTKDPLDDHIYHRAHAREERKEKQLRNIEKERAMHEKCQLERILEGLRGHDWLRVMGISGITDGDKRAYEPKRDHLIREVQALLKKFRLWKEEEKRRKAEREVEDDSTDEEDNVDGETDEDADDEREEIADSEVSDAENESTSNGDPSTDDLDASAAHQLHMEAISANNSNLRRFKKAKVSSSKESGPKPQTVEAPFQSFFKKPYLRAAAMGKHRRSGRSRMAFGQPIPDIEERPFDLPAEIRTADAMRESGRRMRQMKREHRD